MFVNVHSQNAPHRRIHITSITYSSHAFYYLESRVFSLDVFVYVRYVDAYVCKRFAYLLLLLLWNLVFIKEFYNHKNVGCPIN